MHAQLVVLCNIPGCSQLHPLVCWSGACYYQTLCQSKLYIAELWHDATEWRTRHCLDCVHEHFHSLAYLQYKTTLESVSSWLEHSDASSWTVVCCCWSVVIANRATSSYSYWWDLKRDGKWRLNTSWSIHWHPCHSLATADGFLLHYLTKDVENSPMPSSETSLIVGDGNAVFHYLHEVPGNFKQICHKMLDTVLKNTDVVFSTDMYYPESVMAVKRRRRRCAEKLVLQGEMTKRPADWKAFLTNNENKLQLTRLLLRVWSDDEVADKYNNKRVIILSKGYAYGIEGKIWDLIVSVPDHCLSFYFWIRWPATTHHSSRASIAVLKSGSDWLKGSFILQICSCARLWKCVCTQSRQRRVLLSAKALPCTIYFDIGSGNNNKRLINKTEHVADYNQEYCAELTGVHAFTHCDWTSALKELERLSLWNVSKVKR